MPSSRTGRCPAGCRWHRSSSAAYRSSSVTSVAWCSLLKPDFSGNRCIPKFNQFRSMSRTGSSEPLPAAQQQDGFVVKGKPTMTVWPSRPCSRVPGKRVRAPQVGQNHNHPAPRPILELRATVQRLAVWPGFLSWSACDRLGPCLSPASPLPRWQDQ